MIALIVYDRGAGTLMDLREFRDDEIAKANAARLEAEIAHAAAEHVEIVTLQSDSIDELKRTHARYFKTLEELRALPS